MVNYGSDVHINAKDHRKYMYMKKITYRTQAYELVNVIKNVKLINTFVIANV